MCRLPREKQELEIHFDKRALLGKVSSSLARRKAKHLSAAGVIRLLRASYLNSHR
ncbi:hypothetical protein GCM10022410_15530 [Amphibacillus indicireducens]|uniref:Uncharacterized protein n=1 Tax=Amphibacillus indicireducens TaxID=1076330 RepID=A0ABP7VN27_9BACI